MAKQPVTVRPSTIQKCWGFVLHFGYAESAYPGPIIIHHARLGFKSVRAGIDALSQTFLRDFLQEYDKNEICIDTFESYLRTQPVRNASAGPSFLVSEWNAEEWWPWDSLVNIMPFAHGIWESTEPAENYLQSFVNPFDTVLDAHPAFRTALAEYQKAPDKKENGGLAHQMWKDRTSLLQFVPLKKTPKRRVRLKNLGEPDGAWG